MSTPSHPLPAILFCSVLAADWSRRDELLDQLQAEFGEIDYTSEPIAFIETTYYTDELGSPIVRHIFGFKSLISQDRLCEVKLACNELENRFARTDGRRLFNVDPGLLTYERVVLATGKNRSHRIYISCGIFADLELTFVKNDWNILPWTYPDYAGTNMRNQLTKLREMYKAKVSKIPAMTEKKKV